MLPPDALLTTAMLRGCGVDRNEQKCRLRDGSLRAVRRGVVTAAKAPDDPRAEFVEQCRALQLVLPAGSLISFISAAVILRWLDVDASTQLHALLPPGRRHGPVAGARLHSGRAARPARVAGVCITEPSRVVLDIAAHLPRDRAVRVIERAVERRQLWLDDLRTDAAHIHRRRGCRLARHHLALSGTQSESPLETLAMLLWSDACLPPPEQQAVITDDVGFCGRVDFLWRERRVVVEVDGMAKYADPAELQREKERQNRLIAAGYVVLRFTWADVTRWPERTAAQVRRALAAAPAG